MTTLIVEWIGNHYIWLAIAKHEHVISSPRIMVDMQKLLEVEVKEKKVLFISPLKNVGSQQKVI